MSADSVKQIVARAVTDAEFRGLLFNKPAKAFEGYELTDQEQSALQGLSPQEFDSLAGSLDERISRVGMMFAPGRGMSGETSDMCPCAL